MCELREKERQGNQGDRLYTFDASLYTTSQIMAGDIEAIEYQGQRQIDLEDVPLLGNALLEYTKRRIFPQLLEAVSFVFHARMMF